jgi:hypothetical protein
MLRKAALILMLAAASSALANAPGWQQTFDQDMQGPRVSLVGTIVERVSDSDHTCFIVERFAGSRFIACNTGYFEPAVFGPGAALKAVGNLGAPVAREFGGHVYDYPIVAGALISLATSRDYYDGDPYRHHHYGHHPFYGHPLNHPFYGHPFHDPFYGPHFGTGIFLHFH